MILNYGQLTASRDLTTPSRGANRSTFQPYYSDFFQRAEFRGFFTSTSCKTLHWLAYVNVIFDFLMCWTRTLNLG